ncbi:MAG: TlpA family protein disulfide reductase [Casimicrobiaceae bacterium]
MSAPHNPDRRRFGCALASVGVSGIAAVVGLPRLAHARPKVGDLVKLPSVTTIDGKTLPPNSWKGKVLLVNKFATWCPFCKVMNPKIEKLLQKERSRGLDVLALSIDRNPAEVPKYMQQHGYSFHAAMWTSEWERALGDVKGLPVYWIIGRDGRLKQIESGELLDEDVAEFARWL